MKQKRDWIEYLSGWVLLIMLGTLVVLSIRYGMATEYYSLHSGETTVEITATSTIYHTPVGDIGRSNL